MVIRRGAGDPGAMTVPPEQPPPSGHGPWPSPVGQLGPPPTRRVSWVKVTLIVGGALVLLVGVFVACTAFVVTRVVDTARPLFDAGNAYLSALGDDRADDAGALRCDASTIAAAADAERLDAAGWTGAVNLTGATTGSSGDEVTGTIATTGGDRTVTVELQSIGDATYCVLAVRVAGVRDSEF